MNGKFHRGRFQPQVEGEKLLEILFGGEADKSAAFDFSGELNCVFLAGDGATLSACKRGFRQIHCGKDLGPSSFLFFPEQ